MQSADDTDEIPCAMRLLSVRHARKKPKKPDKFSVRLSRMDIQLSGTYIRHSGTDIPHC